MNTRLGVLLIRCRWAMGEKAALKKAVSLVEKGQKEKAKEELVKLDDALSQKRDAVLELYQELFPEDCGK